GATWAVVASLPSAGTTGRIVMAQIPASPQTIYVAIHNTSNGQIVGVYKSTDEGASFAAVTTPGLPNTCASFGQCWYDIALAVDAGDPDLVYLGTVGFFRSTDGGTTWTS